MKSKLLIYFLFMTFSVLTTPLYATSAKLPSDFKVVSVTYGGAGGGVSRAEAQFLQKYPIIMIPDIGRDHRDWTGSNTGNASLSGDGNVYNSFIRAGFNPVELWMIDFARSGEQMSSIEEATDDLKYYICSVLEYTGAEKVQLLAHGAGALLARLTIQKYNIAHWIESEVYIAAPFHGVASSDAGKSFLGYPNSWGLITGSDLLREITEKGESPVFYDPNMNKYFSLRTMTISNESDLNYFGKSNSHVLTGAKNNMIPDLDHDALRCSTASTSIYIPFLIHETESLKPGEDKDMDGFKSAEYGGPDSRDDDPEIFPGAMEIPEDGIDQDCNGCDLVPELRRDGEVPLF